MEERNISSSTSEDVPFNAPGWYRVCRNTIARKDVSLESQRLRILPMGTRVYVERLEGRRVFISLPVHGWCSTETKGGQTILAPLSIVLNNTSQRDSVMSEEIIDIKNVDILEAKMKDLKSQNDDRNNEQIDKLELVVKNLKQQNEELEKALMTTKYVNATKNFEPIIGDAVMCSSRPGNVGVIEWIGSVKELPREVVYAIVWDAQFGKTQAQMRDFHLADNQPLEFPIGPHQTWEFVSRDEMKVLTPENLLRKLDTLMAQLQAVQNLKD